MLGGCDEASASVEAVALRSRSKLIAYLAARFGDVAAAEDALSDAFAAALLTWPAKGCPENPEAWLLTAARNKLIDQLRSSHDAAASDEIENLSGGDAADASDKLPDRRLALLFTCAHPTIDPTIRAPLMLQVVLGLEASQIASAFLVSPAAMAQRLVRAKTKIRDAGIPFTIPELSELPARLQAVLDAIYAAFSEGWADPAGADATRSELSAEAIYLGRLLVELLPQEPEALGLLALMLYTEARRPARRGESGEFVPLARQDRNLWNAAMIQEAETLLRRASAKNLLERYQLEAAIQSAHVNGATSGKVPWAAILGLYDALVEATGSSVAMLNRAVAAAEVLGPEAGLSALEAVSADHRVETYQPYWAARAELLARTGAYNEARRAYQVAIGLESDPAVRDYLDRRCRALPE